MCNIHKESNLIYTSISSEFVIRGQRLSWLSCILYERRRRNFSMTGNALREMCISRHGAKPRGCLASWAAFASHLFIFIICKKIGRQGERDLTPASSYWSRELFADWHKIGSNLFHIYLLWVRYGTHTMARTQRSEDNLKTPFLLPGSLA